MNQLVIIELGLQIVPLFIEITEIPNNIRADGYGCVLMGFKKLLNAFPESWVVPGNSSAFEEFCFRIFWFACVSF